MQVTLDLPALAVEGYRTGALTAPIAQSVGKSGIGILWSGGLSARRFSTLTSAG